MAVSGRILTAIIVFILLAISWLKGYMLIIIGIIILLWLIRKGADVFWWYKDRQS